MAILARIQRHRSTRLFGGTSSAIGQFNYSSSNYTAALNEQMATLCNNAKAANIMVMTVSLDMSTPMPATRRRWMR